MYLHMQDGFALQHASAELQADRVLALKARTCVYIIYIYIYIYTHVYIHI